MPSPAFSKVVNLTLPGFTEHLSTLLQLPCSRAPLFARIAGKEPTPAHFATVEKKSLQTTAVLLCSVIKR